MRRVTLRAARDVADGFYAGWNLLVHGWPYPRYPGPASFDPRNNP
jgi:hypothetical protein